MTLFGNNMRLSLFDSALKVYFTIHQKQYLLSGS